MAVRKGDSQTSRTADGATEWDEEIRITKFAIARFARIFDKYTDIN